MAQAAESLSPSSAQREPSMEEILASIRRIIEDSDTGRKPDDDVVPVAANQQGLGEVEMFRSELRDPIEAETVVDDALDPVQLDDSAFDAVMRFGDLGSLNDVVPAVEAPVSISTAVEAAPEQVHRSATVPAGTPTDRPAAEATATPASVAAKAVSAPAPAPTRSGILSEVTGRQVAAAFGELEEAFAASRRRSFDEIAEEMMRPMLQDWLDNNLPTLVEKLVREEIERIARGAAR